MENRFIIVGKHIDGVQPVNPCISFAPNGCNTKNYRNSNKAELEIVSLYSVMQQCASGNWSTLPKGSKSIHVYKSKYKGVHPYIFDGAILVDIDGFNKYDALNGLQHIIFNRFEELCNAMPNLLCIKYSPSGNLHFCIYHNGIKNEQDYEKLAKMYLCCLCKTIKIIIGVDLRDYDGAIDTHLCNSDWQLNVNDSPVKWNINCASVKLSKNQKDVLNAEYGEYMKGGSRKLTSLESTIISGDGETVVNDQYVILGHTGYAARTAIVSAAYFHFKKDIDKTKEWIASMFKNAAEMEKQLNNMVENDTIGRKYETTVEYLLFNDDSNTVIVPDGQYLSDVVDFKSMTNKYYYINAGTGLGKTELVKNLAKSSGCNVAILQMNKALRDGKKHGIEDITYDNFRWSDVAPKDKIHTTIEGFIRNCSNLDLSEYIVIVDEAHLLQDYTAIGGKRDNIVSLLNLLPTAKQIIFMSATPKTETKLYPFEIMKFVKIKNQCLKIHGHPLKYVGRGSKEATRYNHMIKTIQSVDGKHIIFSNKHQECWKKYGLQNVDYTWFHALNIKDSKMQSVLNDNKLLTDITLATIYLGVGVEIKNEKEIHIWFDLSEGWDKSFIEQSIGRPRDAETINLHFFYTADSTCRAGVFSEEDITAIENAFNELVIDIDGIPTVNLVAAKMTGIYDSNFNTYSCRDKIAMLKLGQLVSSKDYFTIYDIELLRRLPYKFVNVVHNEVQSLNTDGKERTNRTETQLKLHLCSRTNSWWKDKSHNNSTYDDMLSELNTYWDDAKNARKMLEDCKYVWGSAVELTDADGFFASMNLAANVMHDVSDYCSVKAGKKVISDFVGAETTVEKIQNTFKKVETAFTKEYLDYRVDCILLNRSLRPDTFNITVDDLLYDIMGVDNISVETNNKIPYPFRTNTWKDALKESKPTVNKVNSKSGGAKKKTIKIQNVHTNEVLEFDSKTECMRYLGVGSQLFSKFVKGGTVKKLSNWNLIS